MVRGIKVKDILLIVSLIVGFFGLVIEGNKYIKIKDANQTLQSGKALKNHEYPLQEKFSSAYLQGLNSDYKHAVQTYSQLLDAKSKIGNISLDKQANIQYNIGTNLLQSGLALSLEEDGTMKEIAIYSLMQAKIAFEQSLRLNPSHLKAKFNLSLLNSIMPLNIKGVPKEQSGVELSNLPIGLP